MANISQFKAKLLSGPGWDDLTKTVDTSSEVWKREIAKNNKVEKYKYEPLSDYEDLCALFMGNTTIGNFSHSCNQASQDLQL